MANEIIEQDTWKLVHDGSKVIVLSESIAVITPHTIYSGTEAECQIEIIRLGLTPLPEDVL